VLPSIRELNSNFSKSKQVFHQPKILIMAYKNAWKIQHVTDNSLHKPQCKVSKPVFKVSNELENNFSLTLQQGTTTNHICQITEEAVDSKQSAECVPVGM